MHTKTIASGFPFHQEFYDAPWCCPECRSQVRGEIIQESEVLIVSEDFEFSQAIGAILQEQGYQIYLAPDVKTAIEEMDNYDFDLLIIQPGQDSLAGLAAASKAKQEENRLKVLIISGPQGKIFPVEAFETDVDDYLVFPFTTAELGRRVAALLAPESCTSHGLAANSPAEWINAQVLESLRLRMAEIRSMLVKATASLKPVPGCATGQLDQEGAEKIDEVLHQLSQVIGLTTDLHRKTSQFSQFHSI